MHIEAVVIKKVPLREHDQLVVLYSRTAGKLAAVAKGSLRPHSKQALAIDEANLVQCELVAGKHGMIMTGAQSVRAYANVKSSFVRWAAAQFFLQAIDVLVYDAQPDERLWECLTGALAQLDVASDDAAVAVFRRCQHRLLETLGYGTCPEPALDETFEQLAQRRLSALALLQDVARCAIS